MEAPAACGAGGAALHVGLERPRAEEVADAGPEAARVAAGGPAVQCGVCGMGEGIMNDETGPRGLRNPS